MLNILLFSRPQAYGQDGYVPGGPKLAYWELGDSGDVLIILHGGPCASHEYLRPEFDELSKVARIIYYDQRGCGKSDRAETYNWQDHVNELHRVVNRFTENHEVFLAGSSWGSVLAILYTYYYPYGIKGIILSGTVPWDGTGQKLEEVELLDTESTQIRLNEHIISEKRKIERTDASTPTDSEYQDISRIIRITAGPQSTNPLWSLKSAPPFSKLERINLPSFLIFRGLQQNKYGIPDWGHIYDAVFPKSELITLENAGHDPWLANPELFFDKAKEFIINNR